MLLKIVTATLAAVILTVLPGCGDPFSDGTDGTTSSLTITAVDGYITGATVTDQQGNTAVSNGDGTYSFVNTPFYPISSTGGTLLATGDAFNADIITGTGEAHMYATSGLVISPITTLLTTITNNKATATIDSTLSAKLASMMGVTEAELLTDFVASNNLELAKIAQAIHLMAQEPGLYSTFKTNLGVASGSLIAGVNGAATTTMNAKNVSGDLSAIKLAVYNQIISDVRAYTGTAAGLEAGIDANKSMLENIATIETLGGDIGGDITSLQAALALVEIAGSGDTTKTITAAQLTALGISSTITDSAGSVALMGDVIRRSTTIKYDTTGELTTLETHITNFASVDTQQGSISNVNLLAAYKAILDDATIAEYKQVSLPALTNSDAAVTASTVAAIQTLVNGVADIVAPTVSVTTAALSENTGVNQTLATATATFPMGSQLGVFSLDSSGDSSLLAINAATGVISVNASPDFETKPSYVFTVKVTSTLTADTTLAVGEATTAVTTGAITNVPDVGFSRAVYSYGAEDAVSAGGVDAQTDSDNQLIITFNAAVDVASLATEKFSVGGAALASGLTAAYNSVDKTYTITTGATSVNVASGSESAITVSGVTINSVAFDTGFTTVTVEARTGITHNSVSYNTVKSPDTSKYWLDRHLGASQVATSSTDTASYGDLYQWGRPTDGHEKHVDSTPATFEITAGGTDGGGADSGRLSTTITPPNDVWIEGDNTPWDWVDITATDGVNNDNGSARSSFLSQVDGSGVCPSGFRVPTASELEAETINATALAVTNPATAFSSFLKMPAAGMRWGSSGTMDNVGTSGYMWTSTADGTGAVIVYFTSFPFAGSWGDARAKGRSVRCLQA
jgi:hypothetical protein